MMIIDQISNFMHDSEKRLGTVIDWRQFEICISTEAYELLHSETHCRDFGPASFNECCQGTVFGIKLKVDPSAKDAFAFVSDWVKLTPHKQFVGSDGVIEETRRQHLREAEMLRGCASLRDLLIVLRFEAMAFKNGIPDSPRSCLANIMPVDCDRLADLFSAVADCIKKNLKEGKTK